MSPAWLVTIYCLLILLAVEKGDTAAEAEWIARKISELRIFEDDEGKMNRSVADLEPPGEVLLVSQFTLAADCRKGRRPSFARAALPAPLPRRWSARGRGETIASGRRAGAKCGAR